MHNKMKYYGINCLFISIIDLYELKKSKFLLFQNIITFNISLLFKREKLIS